MDRGIASHLAGNPSPMLGSSTGSFCTKNKPTPSAAGTPEPGEPEVSSARSRVSPAAHQNGHFCADESDLADYAEAALPEPPF
jgi:hypothetical protein